MRLKTLKQKGIALILTLFVSIIFILLSGTLLYLLSLNYKMIVKNMNDNKLISMSEIGLQTAFNKIKRNFQNVTFTKLKPEIKFSVTNDEMLANKETVLDDSSTTASDKVSSNETYNISGNFYLYKFEDLKTSQKYPVYYRIMNNDWINNGLVSGDVIKKYSVEAITKNNANIWKGIKSDIEIERNSLLNYFIFSDNDLELFADSNLDIKGRIHSNANIFIDTPANINIDSQITAGGHIVKGLKNAYSYSGKVNIKPETNDTYKELTKDNDSLLNSSNLLTDVINLDTSWKKRANDLWEGRIQDSSNSVDKKVSFGSNWIARSQFYETNASFKLISKITGNKETIELSDINSLVLYSKTISNNKETVSINKIALSNDTFKTLEFNDFREGKNVKVIVIDIDKLNSLLALQSKTVTIYASREDAIPDSNPFDNVTDLNRQPNGILIKNASTFAKTSLIVSNEPVYIQGDFNKHKKIDGTLITQDDANYASPNVDTWKPVSVIADSITLLSNSWKSTENYGMASDTEYNLSIVAGIPNYLFNQKLNFFNKFFKTLEQWDGKKAKLRGAFIQLWYSNYASVDQNFLLYGNSIFDLGYETAFLKSSIVSDDYYEILPSITERIEIKNYKELAPYQSIVFKDLKSKGFI